MMTDQELLRRYATQGAEEAFAELVQRHLDLVYSAALRQLNGDAHLARDAAQLVFVDLARKARSLADRPVLAGWLFMGTRFAAAKLVRSEQRRRTREKEAHVMNELTREESAPADWGQVRPVLDEALGALSEADRDAILLRYFEGRPFAEVGARLGLAENAARMRVERAVDKLRGLLGRQGVTSSAGALAAALATQGVVAAPAGLAAAIAAGATGTATAVSGGGALLALLGWTKLQTGVSLALLVAGAGVAVSQQQAAVAADRERATLGDPAAAVASLTEQNAQLRRTAAEARQWRDDDAALRQLRDEVLELRRQLRSSGLAGGTGAPPVAPPRPADAVAIDRLPTATYREPPTYPADMLAAGIPGTVLVQIVVDANGEVRDAFPVKSSRAEFELPAIEAVRKWRFDAGVKSGRTVNTRMQVPIQFTLEAAGTPRAVALGELTPVDNADWF
jgi:RNA polymerase sigma factor (sigma-70 family)